MISSIHAQFHSSQVTYFPRRRAHLSAFIKYNIEEKFCIEEKFWAPVALFIYKDTSLKTWKYNMFRTRSIYSINNHIILPIMALVFMYNNIAEIAIYEFWEFTRQICNNARDSCNIYQLIYA